MEVIPKRKFKCLDCGHEFEEPFGKPRWMIKCPKCGSENVVRADVPQGWGRGWGYCRAGKGPGFGGRGWGRGRGRGWGRGWFGWRG
ncbi:hypothetical protein C7457_0403 [Thermovibrio guaymasensis]|uniref:Uncharacterized protein n=1 Tax=Thermovibrio guaymasensis TaxID=240167 RepID=A0A420W895_9BACT|nr:zinc ribbon domain-containing protein [Thermovibrio guaymasensis]RKQ63529.1 hypothetical protein C7457_0403 [Thermovibrio guaymasensis]